MAELEKCQSVLAAKGSLLAQIAELRPECHWGERNYKPYRQQAEGHWLALQKARTELSKHAQEREDFRAALANLNHIISTGQTKLAVLESELSSMRNSRSWKLTKPLRQLQQKFQGGAGT
jgi:chromosome segregation ATPase